MKSQKVIALKSRGERRWYQDACGTAVAMEILGERWSVLIVRELLLGPRRFGEIRAALPGLSANILTQRLEGLEATGVLKRTALPLQAGVTAYELTPWGYAAEDAVLALSRWAAGSPAHDVTLPLSNTAFMLSLRTMIDPVCARDFDATLGFRVGGDPFRAAVQGGRLEIARAQPDDARVVFEGEALPLAWTFYGADPLEDRVAAGLVRVTGDPALAQRFVDLFALPTHRED